MVRPGGVVQIVGNAKGDAPVDGKNISFKMITVIDGVRGNLVESIERMKAGDIKTKPLMTHFYPLDNIIEAI
jgi:threonine dehydrogenase-like Zn-dependent dehydrogenase